VVANQREDYRGLTYSQYRMFYDALQAELYNKCDLMPRPIGLRNENIPIPKKTPFSQPKDK
jgi:hypothetical protein